ncbi:unnamed protein product, partial [Heterosigma akashiwo]
MARVTLSLKGLEDLITLQLYNGLDMGVNYYSSHSAKEFLQLMKEEELSRIKEEIKEANFLCLIADGSNDTGVVEQEVVHLRYVNKGKPVNRFIKISSVENGTAQAIFESCVDVLYNTVGLKEKDVRSKLVCLNFDGAAVMLSELNGVVGIFKRELVPWAIAIHCCCHNLELVVSDAFKGDPWFKKANSVLKSVFSLYYYSPKKYRNLKRCAEALDEKLIYFGGLQTIRWL